MFNNFFKKTIFFKIFAKHIFGGMTNFQGMEVLNDTNEYQLFYTKWSTEYSLEICFSKNLIPA